MGRVLLLEPFDVPVPAPDDAPPSADWNAGHGAGLVEGEALADARQNRLRGDVAQAMLDLCFTYAEARSAVMTALGPLFSEIIERLLPAIAQQSIGPHIAERLLAAARSDSEAPMRITVHPSALPGLAAILPATPPLPLSVDGDPALATGQVLLSHGSQETALDPDVLLREMRATLATIFEETERKKHHG